MKDVGAPPDPIILRVPKSENFNITAMPRSREQRANYPALGNLLFRFLLSSSLWWRWNRCFVFVLSKPL